MHIPLPLTPVWPELVMGPHLVARWAGKCHLLSGSHVPSHKIRAQWTLEASGCDEVMVVHHNQTGLTPILCHLEHFL